MIVSASVEAGSGCMILTCCQHSARSLENAVNISKNVWIRQKVGWLVQIIKVLTCCFSNSSSTVC
jgi:hypothetical protein